MGNHKRKPRLKDGLAKIKDLMERPTKLSETEQEKFRKIWEALHKLLDDALESVLNMPRDEAYRYRDLLVQHLQTVDVDFVANVKPVKSQLSGPKEEAGKAAPPPPKKSFSEILDSIPEDKRTRAKEVLECYKNYQKMIADGEDGNEVICPECTPEKMLQCINTEDPLVTDEIEEDLKNKGLLK